MHYTQTLLDRATAYVARSLADKRSAEGLAELASLYSAATGQPEGSCRQCQYSDYFQSIQSFIREATRFLHPATVAETKFTFAPGFENETIVHESYGKAVTLENITDEDAKALRKLGFDKIIVEKGAKADEAEGGADKKADSEAVAKAKADTKTAKDALKAEQAAHGETKKQLTATAKERDGLQTQLDKALADLAEATKPAPTPAE